MMSKDTKANGVDNMPQACLRSDTLTARTNAILERQPDIDPAELASLVGCSEPTAKRARTLFRQARAAETALEPAAADAALCLPRPYP